MPLVLAFRVTQLQHSQYTRTPFKTLARCHTSTPAPCQGENPCRDLWGSEQCRPECHGNATLHNVGQKARALAQSGREVMSAKQQADAPDRSTRIRNKSTAQYTAPPKQQKTSKTEYDKNGCDTQGTMPKLRQTAVRSSIKLARQLHECV